MKRFTFLDCEVRSICNAARVTFPHFSTLLRYETNIIVIEEEIDSRQLVRTSVFLVLSRHLRGYRATFATLVHHARFICIFIPIRFCARTQNAYTPISYQFRGNQKAPGVSRLCQRLNTTSNVLTRLI